MAYRYLITIPLLATLVGCNSIGSDEWRMGLANGLAQTGANMQMNAAMYRPSYCTSRLGGTNVGQPTYIRTTCF